MKLPTQTKTKTATAVETALNGLQESSQQLSVSQDLEPVESTEILPSYSALDEFADQAGKTSDSSEIDSKKESENSGMSDADAFAFAAGGVGYFESFASMYVGEQVTIPTEQKEDIATKAKVVIKKHFGNAELPPWLVQWKEEISLGLALGTCMFSVYQQKRAFDAANPKEDEKIQVKGVAVNLPKKGENPSYDFVDHVTAANHGN